MITMPNNIDADIIRTMKEMIPIKAISPYSGGEGESKRADYLEKLLKGWGLKLVRYDYIDGMKVKRSNLVVKYGNKGKTIWVLAHIDTVTEGDRSLWKTPPFEAVMKGGKIYGRGTEDDCEGMIPGLFALKSLIGKDMKYNFGLVLAADEELGSRYGAAELLKEKIFKKGDMFIVPDWGSPSGDRIEIAEKGLLWLKITVTGKQTHAAHLGRGLNTFRESARFMLKADEYLHKKYNKKTKLMPDGSTFEMTKHEANVDSINIIPGKDVFYIDARVIPDYGAAEIIKDLNQIKKGYGVKIAVEAVGSKDIRSDPTNADAEVVKVLGEAIKKELGKTPKLIAIGGGTIAKLLRNAGFDAAVWGIENGMAHKPNEYTKLDNLKKIMRVLVRIASQ
jgi:succinyl-diaminopimelate desuccinylase